MREATRIVFIIFASLSGSIAKFYTALEIDNHPCQPQNLKRAQSYTCTNAGDIVCQNGWQEPEDPNHRDPLNPCSQPICRECIHGTCVSPDMCACEVGWEGMVCDVCIPLPGCKYGHCDKALECLCEPGYGGGFCDIPDCGDCTHGFCSTPDYCMCFDGWEGENCTECIPMAGCEKGHCTDHPHTCSCEPDWEGALCNEPICNPPCVNGKCIVGADREHMCKCETGWSNEACSQCVPYWECPNQGDDACSLPNECHCPDDTIDIKGLCSQNRILHSKFSKSNNGPYQIIAETTVESWQPQEIVSQKPHTYPKKFHEALKKSSEAPKNQYGKFQKYV